MKLPKRQSSPIKKIAIIVMVSLLIIAAAAAVYVYKFDGNILGWTKQQDKSETRGVNDVNYDKPTESQKDAGTKAKQQSINEGKPSAGGESQPTTVTEQPGKDKVQTTITSAQQNGALLQVRSQIYTVTNSGTCTLTVTRETKTITKTAAIQALSSSSTCQGFDVPVNELSPGKWQVNLHFENATLVGDDSIEVII